MALHLIARIQPRDVVGPRDDAAGVLRREGLQSLHEREGLVHREDVVHDDAVGPRDVRPEGSRQAMDQGGVLRGHRPAGQRPEIAQHGGMGR